MRFYLEYLESQFIFVKTTQIVFCYWIPKYNVGFENLKGTTLSQRLCPRDINNNRKLVALSCKKTNVWTNMETFLVCLFLG